MTWGKKKLFKDHVKHEGGVGAEGKPSQDGLLWYDIILS